MAADRGFASALSALALALEQTAVPSMIIGGVAVIARGIPRETVDLDATIHGEKIDIEPLLDTLRTHAIVPRIQDAAEFARDRQVLLLRHDPTGVPIDLSLAWLPFEHEALARATLIEYEGVRIPVATAEDLVVYKATAWRERDRSDIRRLIALHRDEIDFGRIRPLIEEIFTLLEAPERLSELDQIIASTEINTPDNGS